jgi:excisionase family DNA binding protein
MPTATTPHRQSISSLLDAASADTATFRCKAAAPPWAVAEVPTPQPERRVLSLADAAKVVPLSQKTLYRVAQSGRGPFRKVERRWMVYADDLHEWVRSHPTGEPPGASPLARKRPRRRGAGMRARVLEAAE